MGIGIPDVLKKRFGKKIDSLSAIPWAMTEGNTTKQGVSGGIGLAILKEFITLNKGKIRVISGDGFWQMYEDSTEGRRFEKPFPGTSVNIEVRTDDPANYALAGEISGSIF